MRAAPYISCASDHYHQLKIYSIISLLLVLSCPFINALRLWPIRNHLATSTLRHSMGFLVDCTQPQHLWWNILIVPGRRLILALIVSQLPRGSVFVPVAVFGLLLTIVIGLVCDTHPMWCNSSYHHAYLIDDGEAICTWL